MDQAKAAFLERLDEKLQQQGLNDHQVSLAVTGKPDFVRDLRRKGGIPRGDNLARLAQALGTTSLWLLHGAAEDPEGGEELVRTEVRAADIRDVQRDYRHGEPAAPGVPLLGSAVGDHRDVADLDEHVELTELHAGEVIQYLSREPALERDPDAYALTIIGDSMVPMLEPGCTVKVATRQPVLIGDTVIVQLRRNGATDNRVTMVLAKRLVRRSSTWVELRQFNPDLSFRVPIERIAIDPNGRPRIHKVVSVHF